MRRPFLIVDNHAWPIGSAASAKLLESSCRHRQCDVLTKRVDAAIVISNDSDLKLQIKDARQNVQLGLINPTRGYPAGA